MTYNCVRGLFQMKKAGPVSTMCIVMLSVASVMSFQLVPSVNAEYYEKKCMPDFGQHSNQWCWAAAAANSFYWFAKHGYPKLLDEPEKWGGAPEYEEIVGNDTNDKDWYCDSNGYMRLLKEIAIDAGLKFCERFFKKPWTDYVDDYVGLLEKFIKDQCYERELEVHAHKDPKFQDYVNELKRSQDVIILYQWNDTEDIHLVTGVAYDDTKDEEYIKVFRSRFKF